MLPRRVDVNTVDKMQADVKKAVAEAERRGAAASLKTFFFRSQGAAEKGEEV